MKTIKVRGRSDAKGSLHLDVPVGEADAEFDVTVSVDSPRDASGWLPGFLERFREGWKGDELVRGPQDDYEPREPLR